MTVSAKQFKQNIADIFPLVKRSQKDHLPAISHARIFNDGEQTIMQATDRYVAVNSIIEEDIAGGEFEMFLTPETLALMKSQTNGNVIISDDHITINGINYPAAEPVEWPAVDRLVNEAWGDENYNTPGESAEPWVYRIELLKHIKDAEIIPRHNKPHAPTRFKAGQRAYGIIQPKKVS